MVLDLAGRLVAAFQRPVAMLDLQVPLRAAAGIATYPEHARTAAGLLTRAQTASYRVVISDADRCCRLGQYCEAH
jgi:predicted signal transduction protein with EAL and GGDEF domain